DTLRAIAGRQMKEERASHTLEPTALVHEAYLRLVGEKQVEWKNRAQFYAIASRCVRQVLINHANAKHAAKRGGHAARVTLTGLDEVSHAPGAWDVLELHEVLEDLAALDERQARVVELRFFGGLTVEEVASVIGASPRTVESDWRFAKAWLRSRLESG
ncbi:MAG: sigma-70 family RNA polymerase sigma factor, partial [Phycisphaerales bacterium]|nr:sigma-70 family RNA polymerase sigma factor [Phycisphaerales bacterium]